MEEYEKQLEEMEICDRLCDLHMTLRNIPRRFISEYLEIPEDKMEQIFAETDEEVE